MFGLNFTTTERDLEREFGRFGKHRNREPCNGKAKLDIHLDKIFNGKGHTHDSNDIDIQVFRFKNQVRNECERNPGISVSKIYNELSKGVPVEVQNKAPFKKLESSCYAHRRKLHPKLLNDDLDFENMDDSSLY